MTNLVRAEGQRRRYRNKMARVKEKIAKLDKSFVYKRKQKQEIQSCQIQPQM